jgi:chromosome segregation ATPase
MGRGGVDTRPHSSEQTVSKIQDPIIKAICKELGELQATTVYDAKSSLSIEPYKSVAHKLAGTKDTCRVYLDSSVDPRQETLKTDLQAQLHDLEEKRIEITRQLERDKLAHQEGNVLLRELSEKKSELSDKINTIHNELELFDKHLKDLSFKNKKLTATLKEIQAEEETCERELNHLDKEKVQFHRSRRLGA